MTESQCENFKFAEIDRSARLKGIIMTWDTPLVLEVRFELTLQESKSCVLPVTLPQSVVTPL